MNEWDKIDVDKIIQKVDEEKEELRPKTEEEQKRIDAAKILKEIIEEKEEQDSKKEKIGHTYKTALREDDFRTGLRYGRNCLTCKYFFSMGHSMRGWCHYPSAMPRLSRKVLQSHDLDRLLKARKWERTHGMLTCDLWKRVPYKKLGKVLDWTHYEKLPVEGERHE